MRRTPILLLALLAACGGGEKPQQAQQAASAGNYDTFSGGPPGGVLVYLSEREPDELNPITYDSDPAYAATHLMFRALAKRDSTLSHYQPDLALRWDLRPDSTVVLHLRHDARWHDGVPVTAEDVVFTIRMQKEKETASPRQTDVAAVESVSATDSFTVVVKLSNTGIYTVNSLLEVVPVPKHLLKDVPPAKMRQAPFNTHPVGDGFYRFERWDRAQQLVLVANPDMPEGRAAIDRVIFRFVPDLNAAMTELLAGQGDMMAKVPPDQRRRILASPDVKLYSAPRVRPAWIAWNTRVPPLNDVRVRRAILMAIDRPKLAKGLFGEVGEPALSPIPSALWEHSERARPIPYDPAAARQLLAQAGWADRDGDGIVEKNGKPLQVQVDYISGNQANQDVLVAIQSMVKKVGIALQPRAFESTAWVDRLLNQNFQGSLWGWGWGPGVVGPNAKMLFSSKSIPPAGTNFAGYSNPRVDALIDSVLVVRDTATLKRLWAALEQQLIDDVPYAPLYMGPELFALNKRYANVKFRGIEWWEDEPYWYIPLGQRLPRDKLGDEVNE